MSINPVLTPSRIKPPLDGKRRWVLQDLGGKQMRHSVATYSDINGWVNDLGETINVSIWLNDELMRSASEE